ncbi:TolC family outer membrane protein [Novosphingobium sp. 9U]|uniref:TolC family outer membrane protein n=1 Tax=Novosphingobium sp. 9U TaxID=2653158 RepID=UPI0012F475FA|nr:TolC family outer membrane protein [Novosphingobium sp. 9U]VWX53705.1 Type I secretion outer membrane protein, TolC precursor [Novosphingobium sp. 9U]
MARFAQRAGLRTGAGLLALALAGASAGAAQADTLTEALVQAYQTNPTLESSRAQQRANDENVPIAKASGRPNADVTGTYTEFVQRPVNAFTAPERVLQAQAQLGVPIYSGGGVKNQIKAAKFRVAAGQADLRGTESSLFSNVVAAYMDVIQNQAIVGLNRSNVAALGTNLQATSDRFQIGDLTRTDVAQSQSRLALARGDLRNAEANLVNARERYIQLVGKAPIDLQPPPPLPNLPESAETAVAYALDNNPDLVGARERVKASEKDIDVAGASRLPTVSLFGTGTYSNYLDTLASGVAGVSQTDRQAQVGAQLSIPIFQGGRPAAQRRQAQANASATMETEIATERGVIAQVRSAYQSYLAANELIALNQTAVDAAALSLEGVQAENSVGNRTILDILDAEQERLRAQVQLVIARRNAYVAGFSLLAAMGRAEARDLNLDGGALYDPQVNYDRVKRKFFDFDDDPAPVARSTRTVDTPVQDGEIPNEDVPAPAIQPGDVGTGPTAVEATARSPATTAGKPMAGTPALGTPGSDMQGTGTQAPGPTGDTRR